MNIKKIKEKAEELVAIDKPRVIRTMVIICLLNALPSLFSSESYISLLGIVSILCMTFRHGYVVTGLKVARHNTEEISDDDAYVGIKRFKELFSTYILANLIEVGIVWVVAMVMIVICVILLLLTSGSFAQVLPMNSTDILSMVSPIVVLWILIVFIVLVAVYVIVDAYLFATPYLLEKYHMTNMQAIKESYRLMKGHVKDYILLYLSYIGWAIVIAVITGALNQILDFIPFLGGFLAAAISGVVGVYLYTPKFHTSLAIFFEEIAYEKYEKTNEDVYEENVYGE